MTLPHRLLLALFLLPPLPALAGNDTFLPPNEAELGYSHYTLDNGYADWNSAWLDAEHRFAPHHALYGELRDSRRYDLTDRAFSAGYTRPIGRRWAAQVEGSISPEHNFLPKASLSGQLQISFAGGWDVQGGLRHAQYSYASLNQTVLTGERYWGNFRAAYSLYLSRLQGAGTAPSHRAQLGYYYGDRNSATLSYSKGRQAESLGPGAGVLLLDVRTLSLSGRHWLGSGWGLSYTALSQQQGNLYSRKGFRLGLRYAF